MKHKLCAAAVMMILYSLALSSSSDKIFSGTWCVGREGLVISFIGKDSIRVTSLSDESVDGQGTYSRKGATLNAKLTSEELELNMGYKYKVREDSSIKAKILFFTVNGDSVNHPRRWLRMRRCDPAKGIIPQDDEEEEMDDDDTDADADAKKDAKQKKSAETGK
jgi:hypothetical protein